MKVCFIYKGKIKDLSKAIKEEIDKERGKENEKNSIKYLQVNRQGYEQLSIIL